MDPTRFDGLVRVLARPASRRDALRSGLAGALAGLGLPRVPGLAARVTPAFGCASQCRVVHGRKVCRIQCHCTRVQTVCRRDQNHATCAYLPTDPNNCGSCGCWCGGAACQNGICGPCPTQLTRCAGTTCCVDLQTNPSNCGFCGHVCPSDRPTCQGGGCCAEDGQLCPGGCAPGGGCDGCCSVHCRSDFRCGPPPPPPPCTADGKACPAGCAPDLYCSDPSAPNCCSGYCLADGTCGSVPPCVADGQPCPGSCAPGGDCGRCCVGTCAPSGVCGAAGCQPFGGVCTTDADCCDGYPCTLGRCHAP